MNDEPLEYRLVQLLAEAETVKELDDMFYTFYCAFPIIKDQILTLEGLHWKLEDKC